MTKTIQNGSPFTIYTILWIFLLQCPQLGLSQQVIRPDLPEVTPESQPKEVGSINTKEITRPNVLMISIDDLNDWVGYMGGHSQTQTPHLDALAARGRAFTNAHCAVPVCSPSRISVISGLHATTHGSYELGPSYTSIERLRDAPTLHSTFRQNGYQTVSGGKVLHHGFNDRIAADVDLILQKGRGGPRPDKPLHWTPRIWDYGPFPETDDLMLDMKLAKAAANYLQKPVDQPFFMSVGFFRPHVPMYVPPHWFDLFDVDRIELPEAPPWDMNDIPSNFQDMNQIAPAHAQVQEAGQWRGFVQAYLASTAFVDHCVGTVLNGLAKGPHANNTVIVVWSDHGFHLGEKQHWAKRTLWEESTRVPLIFAGSGVQTAGPCAEAVSLIDIYPTLVEMCKLNSNSKLDGISLLPQVNNPNQTKASPAIISSFEGNHAIRSKHWRYIRYRDGSEELYDHRTDQREFKNLAGDPKFKAIQAQLASHLPRDSAPEVKPKRDQEANNEVLKKRRQAGGPVR